MSFPKAEKVWPGSCQVKLAKYFEIVGVWISDIHSVSEDKLEGRSQESFALKYYNPQETGIEIYTET